MDKLFSTEMKWSRRGYHLFSSPWPLRTIFGNFYFWGLISIIINLFFKLFEGTYDNYYFAMEAVDNFSDKFGGDMEFGSCQNNTAVKFLDMVDVNGQ